MIHGEGETRHGNHKDDGEQEIIHDISPCLLERALILVRNFLSTLRDDMKGKQA